MGWETPARHAHTLPPNRIDSTDEWRIWACGCGARWRICFGMRWRIRRKR